MEDTIWNWCYNVNVIRNMETGFSQGVLVGFGGLLLVWGMREVLGALSKQYKIKKNAISRVGER